MSDALIRKGPETWHSAFIVPGPIVEWDGVYYMFYTGYMPEGAGVDRGAVGYVTSPDGVFWTFENPDPLFDAVERDWSGASIQASSALILDDGTWAVWFSALIRSFGATSTAIGRATAPGPDGPWTVDAEPAIVVGGEGTWIEKNVMHPSVIRIGDEWRMYFDGSVNDLDADRDRAIGMATSPDGVTWELYNDPATGGVYAESDPVFFPGSEGAWDEFRVLAPSVVEIDGRFVMSYMSTWRRQPVGTGLRSDLGYATSEDGITWTRASGFPLIDDVNQFGYITSAFASMVDGRYAIYFDSAASVLTPTTATYSLTAVPDDL